VAHRMIEELMIVANEAVAAHLVESEAPGLFRVHAAPVVETIEELRQALVPLGIEVADSEDAGELLRQLLAAAAGRPEETFVTALLLRTVKRAFYSPDNGGHFALASEAYCHFTSPIRRYPDLVCHRSLKALLAGDRERAVASAPLAEVAAEASRLERRAESSERDLLQWKKVRFLSKRVGETFHGRITGVQPFGLFVQLDGVGVDGLVPIRTLADDFYRYESDSHRLVGERNGRIFRLADEVQVLLAGVSLRHRGLDLKLAGMPDVGGRIEAKDSRPKRGRPRR
jgi:ribonuclease R